MQLSASRSQAVSILYWRCHRSCTQYNTATRRRFNSLLEMQNDLPVPGGPYSNMCFNSLLEMPYLTRAERVAFSFGFNSLLEMRGWAVNRYVAPNAALFQFSIGDAACTAISGRQTTHTCFNSLLEMRNTPRLTRSSIMSRRFQFSIGDAPSSLRPRVEGLLYSRFNSLLEMPSTQWTDRPAASSTFQFSIGDAHAPTTHLQSG